MGQIGLLG